MRHRQHTFRLNRTPSHRRCLLANMLKSLLWQERMQTTLAKAKELRRHADRLITLAKEGSLASRRRAIAMLMIRFPRLSSKQARRVKRGERALQSGHRQVIGKLFGPLRDRFQHRGGGYTRITRSSARRGDRAPRCIIEYLPAEEQQCNSPVSR